MPQEFGDSNLGQWCALTTLVPFQCAMRQKGGKLLVHMMLIEKGEQIRRLKAVEHAMLMFIHFFQYLLFYPEKKLTALAQLQI